MQLHAAPYRRPTVTGTATGVGVGGGYIEATDTTETTVHDSKPTETQYIRVRHLYQ